VNSRKIKKNKENQRRKMKNKEKKLKGSISKASTKNKAYSKI